MESIYLDREQIQRRAYELYCERGREHGKDIEDWTRAERELAAASGRSLAQGENPSHSAQISSGAEAQFPARQKPGPQPVAPGVRAQQRSAAAGRNKS